MGAVPLMAIPAYPNAPINACRGAAYPVAFRRQGVLMPAKPKLVQRIAAYARAHKWHRQKWLRHLGIPLLKVVAERDITITHHWVPGRRIRLNAFRHKGYWFHGNRREPGVMASLAKLVGPGDTVIDVGGHIGYVSLYLAHLVGPTGRVFVFEPSPDNLRYLTINTKAVAPIEIVRKAVSDSKGHARFFTETLTGQNSTLIENYANFEDTRRSAQIDEAYQALEVETTTLDAFVAERGIAPDFIKIDIEGAEMLAVRGMGAVLAEHRPDLMVEITRDQDEVMEILKKAGYTACDSRLRPLADGATTGPNRFFLPDEAQLSRAATA